MTMPSLITRPFEVLPEAVRELGTRDRRTERLSPKSSQGLWMMRSTRSSSAGFHQELGEFLNIRSG